MAEYNVLTNITVQQIPTDVFPDRNLLITIPYLVSYSGKSSWTELTSTMSIVIPKNAKYKAQNASGDVVSMGSVNKSLGGYVGEGVLNLGAPVPIFLRGDVITFDIGYRAKIGISGQEITYMTGGNDPTRKYGTNLVGINPSLGIPNLFKGFISKVSPKLPFTLECEDAMWLLKYVPTTTKSWGGQSLQSITQTLIDSAYAPNPDGTDSLLTTYKKLAGITITLSSFSATDLVFNVRSFLTQQGNLAGMLGRIKTQYKIDSYFRGFELRVGLTHYLSDDCIINNFQFQKNILDGDSLSFKRKDDVVLSCIVKSHYDVKTGKTTKDGQDATKAEGTEILVFNDPKTGQFTYISKVKGQDFPPNETGKRFTYVVFDSITDKNRLFQMGVRYLKKYYYDGLTGSFTTFGMPYVKHGDAINITNPILPEMNGMYMVKSVNYHGGAEEGLRQDIALDFKITSIADIESYLN